MPAIDIRALYDLIATTPTLAESVKRLAEALGSALPELRALVPHPDDPNRQVTGATLLGEALTRNTSHIPVDVRDEVGSLKAVLIDRLDRIADLDKRAEHAEDLVTLAQGAALRTSIAAAADKAAKAKGVKAGQ